jgi:hypothetical protein
MTASDLEEDGHAVLAPRTVRRTLIPARLPVISRLQGVLLMEAAGKETASPLKLDLVALDLLGEIARLFGSARAVGGTQNRRDRDKIVAAQAYDTPVPFPSPPRGRRLPAQALFELL